jgi:hypothetical protein
METANQLIEQYELVKEIHFGFANLDHKIVGRIFKVVSGVNAKFSWDINYYCRMADEAGLYIPSAPFGDSLEETESKIIEYVKRFEFATDLNLNEDF